MSEMLSDDSGDKDCCSNNSSKNCECLNENKGPSKIKIFVFGIVILAALAVGTYSIANRLNVLTGEQYICGIALNSIESLNNLASDKDVAFLYLAGNTDNNNNTIPQLVESFVEKLSADKKQVAAFTFEQGTKDYDNLIDQCQVKSFPCVVVLSRNCMPINISGEFSDSILMEAYVTASTSTPSCLPGKGSSCCPK